jgi:hypothetical protein
LRAPQPSILVISTQSTRVDVIERGRIGFSGSPHVLKGNADVQLRWLDPSGGAASSSSSEQGQQPLPRPRPGRSRSSFTITTRPSKRPRRCPSLCRRRRLWLRLRRRRRPSRSPHVRGALSRDLRPDQVASLMSDRTDLLTSVDVTTGIPAPLWMTSLDGASKIIALVYSILGVIWLAKQIRRSSKTNEK